MRDGHRGLVVAGADRGTARTLHLGETLSALPVAQASLVGEVANRFVLRDAATVRAFLGEHPQLVPLVLEVHDAAQRYVGSGTALVLEVVTDPEDEDVLGTLYAFVQTELEPEEARPLMKRMHDTWWTRASVQTHGDLNIALEYR